MEGTALSRRPGGRGSVKVRQMAAFRAIACILTLYIAAEAQVFRVPPPLIFPHFAQGGGSQTTFTFTKPSSVPTVATVVLGANTHTVAVPANGSARLALTETVLTVGSAKITSFPGVELDVLETFQLVGAGIVHAEVDSAFDIRHSTGSTRP